MSFITLLYHEIRERQMLRPGRPSPIDVRQNYYDDLPAPLFVTLEGFEDQLKYLYEQGYHSLNLEEIRQYYYKGKELPEKSVLFTFDDCYQSVKKYAYPLLKKYHFHGVAFVVTGWLHSSPKPFLADQSVCLTIEELEEMKDVFEYANHTDLFHTRDNSSTSAIMLADSHTFSEDLDRCNAAAIVNAKDTFAYPFGLYTDCNLSLLREKGFRLAFTSEGGVNDRSLDPLLLRRNVIPFSMELHQFIGLLEG